MFMVDLDTLCMLYKFLRTLGSMRFCILNEYFLDGLG